MDSCYDNVMTAFAVFELGGGNEYHVKEEITTSNSRETQKEWMSEPLGHKKKKQDTNQPDSLLGDQSQAGERGGRKAGESVSACGQWIALSEEWNVRGRRDSSFQMATTRTIMHCVFY